MIILGIDPGYDRLGIAFLKKEKTGKETLLYSGCIETTRGTSLASRLQELGGELERAVLTWKPDVLAIETLYMSTNQKTAIAVAEARGVVLYIASVHKLLIYEYTPQAVKIATTGYGKSSKEQVTSMIPRLIAMPQKIGKMRDDEFDAIAVALTGAASIRK
jgi:crossover junction endodeoxyribonuclease RuvC